MSYFINNLQASWRFRKVDMWRDWSVAFRELQKANLEVARLERDVKRLEDENHRLGYELGVMRGILRGVKTED